MRFLLSSMASAVGIRWTFAATADFVRVCFFYLTNGSMFSFAMVLDSFTLDGLFGVKRQVSLRRARRGDRLLFWCLLSASRG
jgi:hypothetical protein